MSVRVRGSVVVGLVSLCGLGFGCVPAWAGARHEYLSRITEVPAGPGVVSGPLLNPQGLAVDSGALFVADGGEGRPGRLDKFDATSGAFLAQFAAPTLTYFGQGLAVAHATGEVYAGGDEGTTGSVAVFSAAGALQKVWQGADTPSGGFGCFECGGPGDVAVDNNPSSLTDWAAGDVYVSAVEQGVVDVFKPKAGGEEEYVTQLTEREPGIPFSGLRGVAVDPSDGDVLVVEGNGVDVFEPTVLDQYALVRRITGTEAGNPFPLGNGIGINGVAVDAESGEVYVADQGPRVVYQFSSAGVYLGSLTETPAGSIGGVVDSLAVDPGAPHDVFVGDGLGAVDVFGANIVIPDAASEPASGVSPTAATLNGTVNPAGLAVTECSFEYGTSTGYGQSVPCAQTPAEIGAASAPVAVSASVLGLTPGAVYHYRLTARNANSAGSPSAGRDRVFGPPHLAGESTNAVAQTTATLEAQVNPEGVDTTYRFEYGTSVAYGTSVPVPSADIGSGEGDVPLSAELTGLQAGVTYHYRVVAINAAGTKSSEDETFATVPPALISAVEATDITASAATLKASVNPLGTDTSCQIEYGTDTGYGTAVACAPADVGSGSGDVPVARTITGLSANTTYHYRFVVTNSLGTADSGDHTFIYDTTGPGLPDGRGYEQVTPVQKNGSVIGGTVFGQPATVSADGSHVIASVIQCFADATSCNASSDAVGGTGSLVSFARTSSGWQATALDPSASQFAVTGPLVSDPNTGTALLGVTTLAGDVDILARQSDGSFTEFGPAAPLGSGQSGDHGINKGALSADGSHVVWEMALSLAGAGSGNSATDWAFDPTDRHGFSVYEYVGAGNSQPRMVDVSGGAGSTDPVSACGGNLGTVGPNTGLGAQSRDGATVYFTAIGQDNVSCTVPITLPVDAVYARLNGSRTVAVSQRSPADCGVSSGCQSSPPADASLEGASAEGSRAYFTSTQQLTDSASEDSQPGDGAVSGTTSGSGCANTAGPNGCDLYLYDFSRPAGHELVDVSAGDRSGAGPRVKRVIAISRDGSHVYFVAGGVLATNPDANGHPAQSGQNNLYVYDASTSQTSFVAALPDADHHEWEFGGADSANATADGRFLVFTSYGALTPDDTSQSGAKQVFRYDAQAGQLIRLSVGNDGFEDNGNRSAPSACTIAQGCSEDATIVEPRIGLADGRTDPTMSDDGGYVFFQSPLALTPQALDDVRIDLDSEGFTSYAQNVYEWHAGHVYLISDGRDTAVAPHRGCQFKSAVCLLGTDSSGQNVFFTTVDRLVPQDTDSELDFYDARVGGGFPYNVPASCSGDSCQDPTGSPPAQPTAASVAFSGPGNAAPGASAAKVTVLSRAVHGSSFLVRVKVPGSGRIAITLAGVRTVRRSVSRPGTYTLRVMLTAREQQLLARKHLLRLHVVFTPAGGSPSATTVSITVEPAALRVSHAGNARRATNTDRRAGR